MQKTMKNYALGLMMALSLAAISGGAAAGVEEGKKGEMRERVAEKCHANSEKSEGFKAHMMERREHRKKLCAENPDKCEQMKKEARELHEKRKAMCEQDPKKCEEMKERFREHRAEHREMRAERKEAGAAISAQ